MHHYTLLFLLLPIAICLASCATSVERRATVPPTAEDRAVLQRLAQARDAAQGLPQARELFNNLQSEQVQQHLAWLRGETPATDTERDRARAAVRGMVRALEAAPAWQPAPVHRIAARRGEITIDGSIDESAWQDAAPLELRYAVQADQAVEPPYAEARLLWDEQYLYAAFDVPDDAIVAPPMPRDANVYTQDCVELFLMPDRRFGVYWELNVSPSGAVLDQLCSKYQQQRHSYCVKAANIKRLRHAARVHDGDSGEGQARPAGYTVEIAVPFDQLPGFDEGPYAGRRMWLLAARAEREGADGPLRFHSHAQMLGSFHNIWTLPRVELAGPSD
ncbi:MAG: carbohydrate-binding family 9-like protein [Phycisphaeraceae bacterium]